MKSFSTFLDASWDVKTVWGLHSTKNDGYPYFIPPYSVRYNGNGNTSGAVPVDPSLYEMDEQVTVLGAVDLKKTGYTFAGWKTNPDGSSASYQEGDTFPIGAENIILYAHWEDDNIPTLSIEMEEEDGALYTSDTWTNQTVTVSVYAHDEGSGIASVTYSLDGVHWHAYDDALMFTDEGTYNLTFRATDVAGNMATEIRTVKISRSGLQLRITATTDGGGTYTSGD